MSVKLSDDQHCGVFYILIGVKWDDLLMSDQWICLKFNGALSAPCRIFRKSQRRHLFNLNGKLINWTCDFVPYTFHCIGNELWFILEKEAVLVISSAPTDTTGNFFVKTARNTLMSHYTAVKVSLQNIIRRLVYLFWSQSNWLLFCLILIKGLQSAACINYTYISMQSAFDNVFMYKQDKDWFARRLHLSVVISQLVSVLFKLMLTSLTPQLPGCSTDVSGCMNCSYVLHTTCSGVQSAWGGRVVMVHEGLVHKGLNIHLGCRQVLLLPLQWHLCEQSISIFKVSPLSCLVWQQVRLCGSRA